ncbi:MAG: hypothetical protein ACI8RD_009508, partial [Bacillariaceae sp.]
MPPHGITNPYSQSSLFIALSRHNATWEQWNPKIYINKLLNNKT